MATWRRGPITFYLCDWCGKTIRYHEPRVVAFIMSGSVVQESTQTHLRNCKRRRKVTDKALSLYRRGKEEE